MAKMSKADQQVVKDEAAATVADNKRLAKEAAAAPKANGYYVNLGGGAKKFVPTGGMTKPKE